MPPAYIRRMNRVEMVLIVTGAMAEQVKLPAPFTPAEAETAAFTRRDDGVLANTLAAEVPLVECKRGDKEPHQPSWD